MRLLKKSYEKQITCLKCNAEFIYDSKDIHLIGDMEDDWELKALNQEEIDKAFETWTEEDEKHLDR